MQTLRLRTLVFAAGLAALASSGWAGADPPSRVARLGYMSGAVSFSPAGENDWVQATINRPLTTGDRLWADAGSRVEIQVGGATIRMSAATGVSVLNLDDRITQLQLTQGTLHVRVRRLEPDHVFEIDTPNLAFTLRQPGEYRIDVDSGGDATNIVVRKGQGEVYGEGAAYVVDSRQPYRFAGTGLRDYQYVDAPRLDEFDRWSSDRDRLYDTSRSARYVSQDVVGYQDLDANGTWRTDANYGNVWIPDRVDAGWAPYRDGHWAWVDPWGWTWVDDAPWGFAVSHYGRWANLGGTWGWVPGPVRARAYYAPALVAFVGGSNFQIAISSGNVGGVAWFPLGPREVYRPSYPVSRVYFENVNRSNTVVSTTIVNNYYNNSNVTNVVYANRQVPGAIVAVPTAAFVQSQPVSRAAVRVTREMVASAPVAVVAPVAPTERSVRGGTAPGEKPPAQAFERPVVARNVPPAAHGGFAEQQQQLTAKPGMPLDATSRRERTPGSAASAPLIVPTRVAQPTAHPPPPETGVNGRVAPAGRRNSGAPAIPAASSNGVPAARTAPPVEQRGMAEPRARDDPRRQPVARPPAPVQDATQPKSVPSDATQPMPAMRSTESRGRSEQRGNGDPRAQTVPPPSQTPQRAAEPRAVQPPSAPPVNSAQPAPQRSAPIEVSTPRVAQPPRAAQQQPQRARPDSAPAAVPVEARGPAGANPTPSAQSQPANVERGAQERKPAAGKPKDRQQDNDEPKPDDEERKRGR